MSYVFDQDGGEPRIYDRSRQYVATVCDLESAEVLIAYLNAGGQKFTVSHLSETADEGEGEAEEQWVLMNEDDQWVAYTPTAGDADTLLSHLNRDP